jgi:molybdopterin-guanine dinucleotide biosynthesis protein A
MIRKAAIILAGGKGERFQSEHEPWQDKVLAPLLGKPLLVHAVENVREVVDEIAICVNEEKRKLHYAKVLSEYGINNVSLLVDQKLDHLGGPLVAILTGLKSVDADYCITLPSDMPFVQPKVIDYMFDQAKKSRVVVPMWPNGRLETLLMALEKKSTLEIAQTLCQLGRPRSDDLIRGALNVIFVSNLGEISDLDPELKSFVNINSPEDLMRLQPRRAAGPLNENLHVNRGPLPIFELKQLQEAAGMMHENMVFEASKIFSVCSTQLEKASSLFWGAVSQENKGKSHIKLSAQQTNQLLVEEEKSKATESFLKAANIYELEAQMNEKSQSFFLADRARSDKLWCESRANKIH